MVRYTKQDLDGNYYIESVNGKLFSNIYGHIYGEAICRLAEFENADVVPKSEVEKIFKEIDMLIDLHKENVPTHIPFCYVDSKIVYRINELKKKYTGDQT